MKRHSGRSAFCAGVVLAAQFCGSAVNAQRANENAVTAADDAFGTRVGNESIGLYGPFDARGFSPVNAGNVRVEGLFFDLQAELNGRISRGSTVRVGISAQSYAFPAPTGIAEYSLRLPGDTPLLSTVVTIGPYAGVNVEVDAQVPVSEKFNVGLGIGGNRYDTDVGFKGFEWQTGAVARWRPSGNVQIIGFGGIWVACSGYPQPLMFTAGPYQPPTIRRRIFYGQDWAQGDCTLSNAGVLGRVALSDDWTVRGGMFRSGIVHKQNYGDFFRDVRPDGTGTRIIFRQPRQENASISGEMRVSKVVTAGARRHTFDLMFRGRDVQRDFGGADVRDFGRGFIGTETDLPEPVWNLGPQTNDHTRQGTVGIAYDGLWAGVGGLAVGLQKTFYNRVILAPGLPRAERDAGPLLYSATANALINRDFAVYAGYTRGLEESGSAPQSTSNRGEAMPVTITRQIDAGFRYAITPRLRLVAGVFQVEKPYFSVNSANVFAALGRVRHRGVEISLAGQVLTEGLTVVAGAVLLQPRISGETVDRGLIGPVPVGVRRRNLILTLQYQPPAWGGFAVDGSVNHSGPSMAHADNLLQSDPFSLVSLGARYSFKIGGVPASIRTQVQNIFNTYAWNTSNTGAFFPRSPRRITTTLAADF